MCTRSNHYRCDVKKQRTVKKKHKKKTVPGGLFEDFPTRTLRRPRQDNNNYQTRYNIQRYFHFEYQKKYVIPLPVVADRGGGVCVITIIILSRKPVYHRVPRRFWAEKKCSCRRVVTAGNPS